MPSPTRTPVPRSLVLGVSAVAVLLALLATLQDRWLGQISEADQARLRAAAKNRAEEFARDFDREITRAFLRLRSSTRPGSAPWTPPGSPSDARDG